MATSILNLQGVENSDVARQAEVIINGGQADQFKANARNHVFWHRRDVSAVTGGAEIRFFNEDPSSNVTNWKRGLPNGELFLLQAVRIGIFGGYQVDGTAEANSDGFDTNGSAALQLAGDKAALIENGLVSMRINDREVIQNVYGVYNFPQGGGPVGSMAAYSTASTVTASAAFGSNGEAHNGNAWLIQPGGGQVIAPKEDIEFILKYNFDRTLVDALTIMVSLAGVYLTPAKR